MKNKLSKNIKTISSYVLALSIVVSSFGFVPVAQADITSTLTIGSQTAAYNDIITVPVTANIVNIQGIQLSINYPESMLRYVGCSSTHIVCSTDVASSTNKINLTWYDVLNFLTLNNEDLLSLQFQVVSSGVTDIVLSFTPVEVINNIGTDITGNITFNSGTLTLNPVTTLSSVAITHPANKLTYTVGDALDITGLVVTGTYSDASTEVETITTANITGFDSSVPATGQVLTITVEGQTVTYTIDVVEAPDTTPPTISLFYPADNATNVSVDVQPTLTFSEAIDTSTMNGENIELREYATLSSDAKKVPAALTYSIGNKVTFILSSPLEHNKQYYFFVGTGVKDIAGNSFAADTWYHAQRANHEFTTEAAPLSSIAITHSANKLSYFVGEPLDITGLEVTGHYSDGSTQIESITPSNVTGFDSSVPATGQVLTITFGGKTTTYTVNIVAPLSSAKDITSFGFAEGAGVITGNNIAVTVPFGTDVTALVPTIVLSGGTVSPLSGVAQNFTNSVSYTVTAADSSSQTYTVTVTIVAPSDISALTIAKATAQGLIDANATESATPGDHIIGSLATLTSALGAANATEASVQSVVDGQVSTLNSAISTYNLAIVPLSSMTAYNATLAAVTETNYTIVTWTSYQLVVTANVVTSQNTQVEVDTATANISAAQDSLIAKAGLEAYTTALAVVHEVDYTTASWTIYQVIVNANVVTDQDTQEAVTLATSNITAAQANLVAVAVMTAYNTALSAVTEADYTLASWATYQGVVATNVVTNQDLQSAVDNATANIVAAQGSLVTVAEANAIALLNTAKGNAGALTQGDYTVESWTILTTALSLSETTTTQIMAKTTAINNAISNLILSIGGETFALTPVGNEDGTVSGTITGASEATTVSSGVTVTFNIPAGTTITGPAGWDGTLNLPTATSSYTLTPDSGNTASALSVIEVGLGDTPLTLNQAVKLTFAGQADKLVGWSQAGVFHQITATCDSATNPTLADGADCKIDAGSDLVVWTKHLTSFVSYTQTAIPAPPSNSSSSRSGGGSSGSRHLVITTPVVAPTVGIVLGSSAYNFTHNLSIGSSGGDVTELQNRLTTEGVYTGPITGYFGSLTLGGVKAYQAKYGINQTGFVGPLTLAKLNEGGAILGAQTTAMTMEQMKALLAQLQAQVAVLLLKLNSSSR